jgi:hypothetical protein
MYNVDMEVHADINTNPNFKSNDALKEAMGYILGMGFRFQSQATCFCEATIMLNIFLVLVSMVLKFNRSDDAVLCYENRKTPYSYITCSSV